MFYIDSNMTIPIVPL